MTVKMTVVSMTAAEYVARKGLTNRIHLREKICKNTRFILQMEEQGLSCPAHGNFVAALK